MHTVDVSYSVKPSYGEMMEYLTPKNIIDSTAMYHIESIDHIGDREKITVIFEDERLVFEFSEIEDGYEYTLVDSSGLFAERHSKISINDGENTQIIAETQYTFDTWVSFILDRLAAGTVRDELEITIKNLVDDAMEADSDDE